MKQQNIQLRSNVRNLTNVYVVKHVLIKVTVADLGIFGGGMSTEDAKMEAPRGSEDGVSPSPESFDFVIAK